MAGTEVYFTVDGMPKHKHEGAKGYHTPHIKHGDGTLHDKAKASAPTFREGTTEELKKRYAESLAGKSFEYLWAPGREARRAERVAAGGPEFIHHGKKAEDEEPAKEPVGATNGQ